LKRQKKEQKNKKKKDEHDMLQPKHKGVKIKKKP